MSAKREKILILCKTYPSPSGKYSETSCVAGINARGELIRLFPVPFRLIGNDQQFKKWQWVTVQYQKARKDRRPESHTINIDAIQCDDAPLDTKNNWERRRQALKDALTFANFEAMESNRQARGQTIAVLRPRHIVELEITPVKDPNWTDEELDKLLSFQKQAGLFDDKDRQNIVVLRKLPVDFHYRYICDDNGVAREYRHKIVDWEAGALYWNCVQKYGSKWEQPFREKMQSELPSRDLMFLMGTIHRFPDQWLIISLIYPPKDLPRLKTLDLFGGL